ncbi:MAG: polysaccharide deacetylase family protein [Anaerolineales bacterium]
MPRLFGRSLFSNAVQRRLLLAGAALACAASAACGATGPAAPTALPTVRVVTLPATATVLAAASATTVAIATVVPATLAPGVTPDASATLAPTLSVPAATESQPTPDAQGATRPVRLPILMYHYVEPWPADADEIRQGLTVRPEDFAAQMAYLHDHGYVTVSLYDLADAVALGRPLPEKALVLTFDDGYRSLVDQAVPVMKPYGYTGTVFVITQLMDDELPAYLTWPQAEALYAQGWKIEPHTKTHEELAGRDRDFQLYQMLGSIQTVQAHIGRQPRFLAYPSGKRDDLTLALAGELNLWGAVTVDFGRVHRWQDRYEMTRVRVSGTAALSDFVNALEGDLP